MLFDKEKPRVAIIGSGLGGIIAAISLKKQLGFENFVIYEKGPDIGGTWRVNTYPGCGSDVPGHWYSLSTELNPYWSSYFVSQPEILEYWDALVAKYSLREHIVVNTRLVSAVWDNTAQLYHLTLHDEKSGEERRESVEAVISAMGGLEQPAYPSGIPGRETFKGAQFHSARWRHDVQLKGMRVGVVGNACSAAQLIPEISKDPSVEVINFCRTPSWFVPRINFKYPPWVKWAFANLPLVMRAYRSLLACRSDFSVVAFRKGNKRLLARFRKVTWLQCSAWGDWFEVANGQLLTERIERKAPKEYLDKLVPDYPPGCKRLIVDPGYLDSLHRSNVTLIWDSIAEVVPEGIVTRKGEVIPLDVIIWATGFDFESTRAIVVGCDGTTMQEYYNSQGGPTAYLGTTMPGFPNFFLIAGPNTATGHASLIFAEEVQINYAIKLLEPILARKAKSFSVRVAPTNEYNALLQRRIKGSVFVECSSYYRTGMAGKNFAMFPGPLALYWWWARAPRWEDYDAVGADVWARDRRRRRTLNVLLALFVFISLVGSAQPGVREVMKHALAQVLSWLLLSSMKIIGKA